MQWFKHTCAARKGEFIQKLISVYGLEGYARWFFMLEIIGERMDKSDLCWATFPLKTWMDELKCRRKNLGEFLTFCAKEEKIIVEHSPDIFDIFPVDVEHLRNIFATSGKDVLTIKIPNLLKIKDEYSRKSGHAPDNVAQEVRSKNKELKPVFNNSEDGNSIPPVQPQSKGGFKSCLNCKSEMQKHHDECPHCGKSQKQIQADRNRLRWHPDILGRLFGKEPGNGRAD